MKRTFTLLAVSCLSLYSFAQQPLNPGFENWTSSILYEDTPPYLSTSQQSYFALGSGNVWSVPSPVQGVYAAHLETMSNTVDTIAGGLFLGTPGPGGINGGIPFTQRPDSLVFWCKKNVMPGDTANVIVVTKFMTNIMGYAFGYVTGSSAGYQRYSFPFTYMAPVNPDSLGAVIMSSVIGGSLSGYPGSWIEIDSIRLINSTQQLPNPNFENWTPHVVNEPDNWMTLNFGNIYDGNYSVTQDNTPYTGTYDCKIETTVSEWGDTIGYITNGNFNGPNGPGGGMQVVQNPQKITGYYKYIPVGLDTALAGAWTYHWDWVGDSAMLVEQNLIQLPAASGWTYFEINFTYNTWPNIDTLNISFASSNFDGNPLLLGVGSQLYLDELGVSYYPLGVMEENSSAVSVFPNPTTRFLNVTLENISAGENSFNVYDSQGKLVKSEKIQNGGSNGFYTMELSELPAGNYVWEILGGDAKTSGSFLKE